MKKLIFAILLCMSTSASAEYMDVIQFTLDDGCSLDQFMQITEDFNKNFGAANGYMARVAVPVQNANLDAMYWLGTTKDAATFGKAWDTWRDALSDVESAPAKLWERLQACSTNTGRWGYDIY